MPDYHPSNFDDPEEAQAYMMYDIVSKLERIVFIGAAVALDKVVEHVEVPTDLPVNVTDK